MVTTSEGKGARRAAVLADWRLLDDHGLPGADKAALRAASPGSDADVSVLRVQRLN
jgi:hypothetical protein